MGDKEKMYEALAKAERISEIKRLPAWEKDLKPKLELMILQATGGGEKDGKFYPGKIFKKDASVKEIDQKIGYASAIMDIYNTINAVDLYIENLRDKIKKVENKD